MRSCQSEPAILRDLEDSYGSDRIASSSNRWSADNLGGQDLADTVHPPRHAPEVTMNDEAAEDLQCWTHHAHPTCAPQAGQDVVQTGGEDTAEVTIPRRQVSAELKEHVGSGDCTPVVCPSPPVESRRFGGRMLRCLPVARVQTAPELSKASSHTPLVEQADSDAFLDGEGGIVSLPCVVSTTALTSDSSSLSSPEHAPCSPWVTFNTADTPLSVLTSPLPPKNFRFSLELSVEDCHRPLDAVTNPQQSVSERFGSISSDYGSGDIGSQSQNGTSMFCDDMRLCTLSLDARLKSNSAPSIKLPRRQSLNHSHSLRSWSSDSSRSSVSSFKCFDVKLHKNGTFSSSPNFLSTYLHTST